MKVFYITLKGGMQEVARFMTQYLAAYDYSQFEVKHDFSGYPVIIFEPHFEKEEMDFEISEIQEDLHFELITWGICEQEELNINSHYGNTIQHKINHFEVEFAEFCANYEDDCIGCKYENLSDCKIAFMLDKAVNEHE